MQGGRFELAALDFLAQQCCRRLHCSQRPPTDMRNAILVPPGAITLFEMQDHFRKSRKPSYTNVFHDRGGVVGVVEFETKEDLKAAIHDLDGARDSGCSPRSYPRFDMCAAETSDCRPP